jgi:hypothetical protein
VVQLCSSECLSQDCGGCPARSLLLPRFAEGFSGPRAPASWAVAVEGIATKPPLDRERSTFADFFTPKGFENFEPTLNGETVAFEHWGPECKLMSRARGRPIVLASGQAVRGPQAVRSAQHPQGFPWVKGRMIDRVRRSNDMADYALERLEWRVKNWVFAVVEHGGTPAQQLAVGIPSGQISPGAPRRLLHGAA